MNKEIKYQAFEYIVYRIYKWYNEETNVPIEKIESELTIMKLMMLLFLISGVDTDNHLFDIFRFQAWQYGQMEPDIYNIYSENKGKFKHFEVGRFGFKWLQPDDISTNVPTIDNKELQEKLDICIDILLENYPRTVQADWYHLSELCRSFVSYKEYNKPDIWNTDIDKMLLIYEPKYYF